MKKELDEGDEEIEEEEDGEQKEEGDVAGDGDGDGEAENKSPHQTETTISDAMSLNYKSLPRSTWWA